MSEIAGLIREIAGTRNEDKVRLLHCEVNSVNIQNRLCEVTSITGDSTLTFNAQITAGVSDGFVITPEIGSMVYVLLSKYTLPFIVLFSDIEKYVINGGEFGGLVKIIELTEKINELENKVNEIIEHFNSLTLPVVAVGSPTGTPVRAITSGSLQITKREQLENKNITHG